MALEHTRPPSLSVRTADLAGRIDVQAHTVADLDNRIGQIDAVIAEQTKREHTSNALATLAAQQRSRDALVARRWAEGAKLASLRGELAGADATAAEAALEAAPLAYVAQLIGAIGRH